MQGSNDLTKTEQEVYDGSKRETQLLFFSPKIALVLQSCAPQILLLLGWRKKIAIYIFYTITQEEAMKPDTRLMF